MQLTNLHMYAGLFVMHACYVPFPTYYYIFIYIERERERERERM
jgi:hypothetical protein